VRIESGHAYKDRKLGCHFKHGESVSSCVVHFFREIIQPENPLGVE
jgi:hypothetical protein